MSIQIYHVIDSLGIGGGQSMLFELHEAIRKYLPQYQQKILLFNSKRLAIDFVDGYGIQFQVSSHAELLKEIRIQSGQCIVVYHKLMLSRTDDLKQISKIAPIVLINHTHTDSLVYNKIRNVHHVVAVCAYMMNNLSRMGVRAPMTVIHNSVNGDRYDEIDANIREEGDILLTGRINALNSIKYSDSWVEWCAKVHLPKKMVHEYIGPGAFCKHAIKYVSRLGSTKNEVRILGAIPDFKEKIARLKTWDIFLYEINRHEGLSIAILEALASGVPVICSNHYGNKEVIENGVNGYVFQNRDEAANLLTEFCLNPQMIEELKESTKRHFRDKLEAKVMASKYGKLFEDILANKTSSMSVPVTPEFDYSEKSRKKLKASTALKVPSLTQPSVVTHTVPNATGPKFTILTAGYNSAGTLDQWLSGIIPQRYRPLDVVFVDDGSKDKTKRKIIEFAERFQQLNIGFKTVFSPKNLGCGSAYALAAENAKDSVFYGIVDADDILFGDAVATIAEIYQKNTEIAWIYSQFQYYTQHLNYLKEGICRNPASGLLDYESKHLCAFGHWRTFSNRIGDITQIFKKGLRSAVDKYMGYRLEELGKGMFLPEPLYRHRIGLSTSITKSGTLKRDWQAVIEEAQRRRLKNGIIPYQIVTFKREK